MKIFKESVALNKKNIYLDVDDVLLLSSWLVIDVLNKKRIEKNLPPRPRQEFLHDFNFKSIDRGIPEEEKNKIFDSDYFFENVQFNDVLLKALSENQNELFNFYNWHLVTKGSNENLNKKFNLISNHIFFKNKPWSFYGLKMKEPKSMVHMYGGIQIDDIYENLINTDANIKILLKNEIDTDYNMIHKIRDNLNNLYILDNTKHLIETLKFIKYCEENKIENDFNFFDIRDFED